MEHYFSKKPVSAMKVKQVSGIIRGFPITLKLGSGTFSAKKIDAGSRLLAEAMQIRKEDSVLDLGCGTGIAGIIAAKLTKGNVVLTDINERACRLARENSKGMENVKVVCGNMYEKVKERKFDVILLNPPQTAGKVVCFKMIEDSKQYLNKNGSLQLVARHTKGGETLSRHMKEVFGNLDVIARKGGYRVYISVFRL